MREKNPRFEVTQNHTVKCYPLGGTAEHVDYTSGEAGLLYRLLGEALDELVKVKGYRAAEKSVPLPPTPGCQVCDEDEACGYCVVDHMNRQRLMARAVIPRSGELSRILRRTIASRPIHDFPVQDQKALHHLANLIDCPQCQAPYEVSGTCEACGRKW